MVIHQSMLIQWLFFKKTKPKRQWPQDDLWPNFCSGHVWFYPRIIVSKSHKNMSKYVDTVNLFFKTWIKGHWPLDDLWPQVCWGWMCWMCDSTQGLLCKVSHENTSKCVDTVTLFSKPWTKGHWPPYMTFDPTSVEVTYVTLRIIVSKSQGNISMYVDTVINLVKLQPRLPHTT